MFYVVGVLGYDLNDLGIKSFSLLWVFLAKPIRFLESVGDLMVEINFLSELLEVLLLDLLVKIVFDVVFHTVYLEL